MLGGTGVRRPRLPPPYNFNWNSLRGNRFAQRVEFLGSQLYQTTILKVSQSSLSSLWARVSATVGHLPHAPYTYSYVTCMRTNYRLELHKPRILLANKPSLPGPSLFNTGPKTWYFTQGYILSLTFQTVLKNTVHRHFSIQWTYTSFCYLILKLIRHI